MKVEKKVIAQLRKCYAVSPIDYRGKRCFLVAAEKQDPCYLFSEDGTLLETVWKEPGGTMTIEPIPGGDGAFLATHQFYSPNDSKEAKIIYANPCGDGWQIRTLCNVPYVHRFGILRRNDVDYLIVCCLKSGYEGRDDWRFPGGCFGAVLPREPAELDESNPLKLVPLKTGLLKNHGFSKTRINGRDEAVVGTEAGTFLFSPPAAPDQAWEIRQLCAVPSSDSVLMDFDGDGKPELGCISPFHGNSLTIYHLDEDGNYVPQWKYPAAESDTEMIHATYATELFGVPTWLVGWRQGTRETVAIFWDAEAHNYAVQSIDRQAGCANCVHFETTDGRQVIVAANREIDEVAYYTLTP